MNSLIVYFVIAILAVCLVVFLVKKLIKIALFVIGIIVVLSLINILVYGVSPRDEIMAYKTNIEYTKSIAEYTNKIKHSVDNIKKVLEAKKVDKESIDILNEENKNLHEYKEEVEKLKHTKKMDIFHDKYCGYLETIVEISDNSINTINTADNVISNSKDILDKFKEEVKNLELLK